MVCQRLFPDYFDKDPFPPAAVEFPVKDLFPRAEIEFGIRDGNHDFSTHDLAFQVSISIILASPIVVVLGRGRVRGQFFEPNIVVVQQALLGVIDEYRSRDVHGVDQAKTLSNPAFSHQVFNGPGDVDETTPAGDLKPKLFP
jgi:hypothetical protein